MATFPHNLCGIRQDGHAEQHTPVVSRSEVERGMPRQRRTSADALVSVPCTLVFRSAAAAAEFEAWYYAEGFGWFDFTLPRTGAVVQARIVGGDIGGLTPITPAWNASERSITLEYRRPGFIQLPPGLHSVNPARILSVQRNSTATYVDDAGLLQTAAANVARYQGGQVLVEGEATNLVAYSQDFSSLFWINNHTTITPDSAVGPNGSGAAKLVENTGNSVHGIYGGGDTSVFAGSAYSASVFLKDGGRSLVRFVSFTGLSDCVTTVDLSSGSIVASDALDPRIDQLSNGWFRVSHVFTAGWSGASIYRCQVYMLDAAGNVSYAGNGLSGVYVFGAQVEEGAAATSYIPTTTTPATRAADIVTVAA